MDFLGGVLLYGGLAGAALGVACLVRPLRFTGIRTRKAGLIVVLLGFFLFMAGVSLPATETHVPAVRSRLDEFAPVFQFNEFHRVLVFASKDRIYAAIREVRPEEIRYFTTLMRMRFLSSPPSGRPILDNFLHGSFLLLADERDREIVFGRGSHAGRALQAGQFAALRGAPSMKIVMNFRIEEESPARCVVTTETRIYAAGGDQLRGFGAYWRMIHPGSALIRSSWLRAIKLRAEAAGAS